MEAIVFVGVQGAGKTTFYLQHFFASHVRISRDMVKTRHREHVLVTACLVSKQPFIVDNTNALREQRAEFIGPARVAGFRVVGYYFRCELSDALRRNEARMPGQIVPRAGVIGTYKRLQPPVLAEGFDALRMVVLSAENEFIVSDWPCHERDELNRLGLYGEDQ
jgi:predicted kinase